MGDANGGCEPFLIFPEEIWEKILDKLEDSRDILNVLQAFPLLGSVFKTKLPLWLFGRAFPGVIRYLDTNEILSCRQVCRRWSRHVDHCLENSGGYHGLENRGLLEAAPGPRRDYGRFFGGNYFLVEEMFTEFLDKLGDTPPGRSPFIGRQIEVYPHKHEDIWEIWAGVLKLFRKFGEHIWFLNISTGLSSEMFLEMLGGLPNLKTLYLGGWVMERLSPQLDKFLESRRGSLPPLPQLESLDIEFGGLPPKLGDILFQAYSPQLRRLQLQLYMWRNEYAELFTNLVELTVSDIGSNEGLLNLLMSINAPQLSSLRMVSDRLGRFVIKLDIFPCLRRFPKLSNLNLNCVDLTYNWELAEPVVVRLGQTCLIPSLKSLVMYEDPQVNYDLLLCFPSLEYLRIQLCGVGKRNENGEPIPGRLGPDQTVLKVKEHQEDVRFQRLGISPQAEGDHHSPIRDRGW